MSGVYISYPFCAQKCTYCNFASDVSGAELRQAYGEMLRREIGEHVWAWTPETVYLGGGTPSLMDAEEFRALLDCVPGRPWREATVEAAPGTLTRERVHGWVEAGVNRVSLGVQSFVQRELARTGRRHTAEVVAADIDLLRGAGIANFNIDLIAGLPGQTAQSWRASLEFLERLEAPHASVYMLEVDEDSRLGREIMFNGQRYGAPEVPDDAQIVEMYEAAVEALRRMGLPRYEISNFARPGLESVHNLKYWRLEPYAGFGADAHSFDGEFRCCNTETADEYVACMRDDRSPRVDTVRANAGEERFLVGLRLSEGMRPAPADWVRFAAPIERFVSEGLLENEHGLLRLSDRGLLFSNEVLQEFIGA